MPEGSILHLVEQLFMQMGIIANLPSILLTAHTVSLFVAVRTTIKWQKLICTSAKKGTFYYGGSYPAVYTINNVSHGTGNQEIKLVCSEDNGTWDAYVDYFTWQ